MAATIRNIRSQLRQKERGWGRTGPCFGAPDTNPIPPEPTRKGVEAARQLLDDFKW